MIYISQNEKHACVQKEKTNEQIFKQDKTIKKNGSPHRKKKKNPKKHCPLNTTTPQTNKQKKNCEYGDKKKIRIKSYLKKKGENLFFATTEVSFRAVAFSFPSSVPSLVFLFFLIFFLSQNTFFFFFSSSFFF